MTDRTGHRIEEPLFLDEAPDMPPYRKTESTPTEELFADEPVAQKKLQPRSPTGALVLLFVLAALLAFASVRAWFHF
jgi:hypothetical protein